MGAASIAVLCSCSSSSPPSEDDVKQFLVRSARTPEEVKDLKILSVKKNDKDCNTFGKEGKSIYVVVAEYKRDLGNCSAKKPAMPGLNCGVLEFNKGFCLTNYDGKWDGSPMSGAY